MNKINKITAEDSGEGLRVVCKGELGFVIATARELLNAISEVGPGSRALGFAAAFSTIIETAFDDPKDRAKIATLLYREFGGDGKCMKF